MNTQHNIVRKTKLGKMKKIVDERRGRSGQPVFRSGKSWMKDDNCTMREEN